MDDEKLKVVRWHRLLIYCALTFSGLVTISFGLAVKSNPDFTNFFLDQVFVIGGTILLGLGFAGIVTVNGEHRFSLTLLRIIGEKFEDQTISNKRVIQDHVAANDLDEIVPSKYRAIVYIYHQTSARISGARKTIWVLTPFDFSNDSSIRRPRTIDVHEDPKSGDKHTYETEILCRRKTIIIYSTNLTDIEEKVSVFVFDVPVLRDITCGFLFHMDWSEGNRVSKAIFSLKRIEYAHEETGSLIDNNLENLWDDFVKKEKEYKIFT